MSATPRPFLSDGGPNPTQRERPVVVFAHANGYPPESYRALLTPLAQQCDIYTVEHRPLWIGSEAPHRLDWSVYANDLSNSISQHFDQPVWLCGHSMGAVVSMLVGLNSPQRVRGLVALDPVLLPLSMWLPAQLLVRLLGQDLPISKVALKRPHAFQGFDAAFAFYRSKRPFRRLSDAELWDYVQAGHEPHPGHGVVLRWSGAWEACVYRSAPYMLRRLRQWRLPMLGIAGEESDVLNAKALASWQAAVPQLELHTLAGGHLIPLEQPAHCSALIADFISKH